MVGECRHTDIKFCSERKRPYCTECGMEWGDVYKKREVRDEDLQYSKTGNYLKDFRINRS